VPGHQKQINFEDWGNSFAAETLKEAALTPKVCLISHLLAPPITPLFTPLEKGQLKKTWDN
jgi:hypothetical protein